MKDKSRTNQVRKEYRNWRNTSNTAKPNGNSRPIPHQDLNDVQRLHNVDNKKAKFKRNFTEPDNLQYLDHKPKALSRLNPTQTSSNSSDKNGNNNGNNKYNNQPIKQAFQGVLQTSIGNTSTSAPMLRTGGCPFPQGSNTGLPPLPLDRPASSTRSNADTGCVPAQAGYGLASVVYPPSSQSVCSNSGMGRNTDVASNHVGKQSASCTDSAQPDDPQTLTPGQLAAFRAAYHKALEQQKALFFAQMNLRDANPFEPQVALPGAPQSLEVKYGTCLKGSASAAPTCLSDELDSKVLATSCANGPLVTHPDTFNQRGALAAFFPPSEQSWLYVVFEKEFNAPFDLGISATGCIFGRLYFKSQMQQWVLLQVDDSEWKQVDLKQLVPLLKTEWDGVRPPKSRTRWVCFPYLVNVPDSHINLDALLASGEFPMQSVSVAENCFKASSINPEALIQRDIKSIGARPAHAPASIIAKSAKTTRKRAQKPKEKKERPTSSNKPTSESRNDGLDQTADSSKAKRQRCMSSNEASSSADGYSLSNPATNDALRRQILQYLQNSARSENRSSESLQEDSRPLGSISPCSAGHLSPTASMLQVVALAQQQSMTLHTDSSDLPASPSISSLLNLLRSNSIQTLGDLAPESRGNSITDLGSFANLARVASLNACSTGRSMPPPISAPSGRNLDHARLDRVNEELLASLVGMHPSMKESPSASSLFELVRSSSATSLVELMQHNLSHANLSGLGASEQQPK